MSCPALTDGDEQEDAIKEAVRNAIVNADMILSGEWTLFVFWQIDRLFISIIELEKSCLAVLFLSKLSRV